MTTIEVLNWAIFFLVFLVFAYCLVRGVSFAYFRTKLEYLRQLMQLKKGD